MASKLTDMSYRPQIFSFDVMASFSYIMASPSDHQACHKSTTKINEMSIVF